MGLMRKQLIIGLGTGRCGTTTLSRILANQKNSTFKHESKPILTWGFNKNEIDKKLKRIISQKGKYVGDVGLYYLNYVEYIIGKHPSSKFVILKRKKEEVVRSFLKKSKRYDLWRKDHLKGQNTWIKAFPKYGVESKKVALENYWEDYYKKSNQLLKKFPSNIILFETNSLNSKKEINNLLDFCQIEEVDRAEYYGGKLNKSGDLVFKLVYLIKKFNRF